MSESYSIIIPARFASTRLPGKPLLDINGKPLIQHVYDTACLSEASRVCIATDNDQIVDTAKSFGAEVVMTSKAHQSGTDRISEVVEKLGLDDSEIVVNLQGDEFGLPEPLLDQVAHCLRDNPDKQMATLCEKITTLDDYTNPNIVKVVFDKDNSALYFSRSPIPANRNSDALPEEAFRHIGLYAYRSDYLKEFTRLAPCLMEKTEALEQLRALQHGAKIHVAEAVEETGIGIDTEEDLERARAG